MTGPALHDLTAIKAGLSRRIDEKRLDAEGRHTGEMEANNGQHQNSSGDIAACRFIPAARKVQCKSREGD